MPTLKDIEKCKAETLAVEEEVQTELAELHTKLDESLEVSAAYKANKDELVNHIKETLNALSARVSKALDAGIAREETRLRYIRKAIADRDGSGDELQMIEHNSKPAKVAA